MLGGDKPLDWPENHRNPWLLAERVPATFLDYLFQITKKFTITLYNYPAIYPPGATLP
jgi:hypothetical protein